MSNTLATPNYNLTRHLRPLTKLSVAAALTLTLNPVAAQTPPADAKPTCTVPAATFKTWFGGTVSANGPVNPANSLTFPDQPNCSFYQWSEQMFLWLTSPTIAAYGGNGRIFDSPVFYDVSPLDAKGKRSFLPHTPFIPRLFVPRVAQVGPHGLPVVLSKTGKLLEILTPPTGANANPLIRDKTGNMLEIESFKLTPDNKPQFFDKAGALIEHQIAAPAALQSAESAFVTKIAVKDKILFLNPFGKVIDTEEGQADDGVLLSQHGSLVYYVTIVNDVYAYLATGAADGGITPKPNAFPTTAAELNKITTFAAAHGKTFPDANALAIELKTSWVEAAGLPNLGQYITMTGVVPTYDKTDPKHWKPNGQKTVQLAMVGMHVVGSTKGHPEMIWATFEHLNNAPNAAYTYTNTANSTITVNQNTAGSWVFTANNSSGPFNQQHMQFVNGDIVANPGFSNTPSDVLRAKAWGAAANVSPNPIDGSATASNTEIISINHSVLSQLLAGDIRSNYIMSGATWTIGGAAPNGGNQVGTNQLSNATMETFVQGTDNTTTHGTANCFSCHTSNTTGVSHVYGDMKPLF